MSNLLYSLDLLGTVVFALTGALKAVKYQLDWLGILVLSAITGVGGGVLRDVILGDTPPVAFINEFYLILSLGSGLLVILILPLAPKGRYRSLQRLILIGDAMGLGVFTLIGAAKGFHSGLGPVGVLFTGAVTACGGGLIRDLLVKEIPALLKRDFYATASILGGVLYLLLNGRITSSGLVMFLTILFTLSLRIGAIKFGINLPVPRPGEKHGRRK